MFFTNIDQNIFRSPIQQINETTGEGVKVEKISTKTPEMGSIGGATMSFGETINIDQDHGEYCHTPEKSDGVNSVAPLVLPTPCSSSSSDSESEDDQDGKGPEESSDGEAEFNFEEAECNGSGKVLTQIEVHSEDNGEEEDRTVVDGCDSDEDYCPDEQASPAVAKEEYWKRKGTSKRKKRYRKTSPTSSPKKAKSKWSVFVLVNFYDV